MKKILTQSDKNDLSTGVEVNFNFKKNKSLIIVSSNKILLDPNFDKPLSTL